MSDCSASKFDAHRQTVYRPPGRVREQNEQAWPDALSVDVVLVISDKGSVSCV